MKILVKKVNMQRRMATTSNESGSKYRENHHLHTKKQQSPSKERTQEIKKNSHKEQQE